MKILSVSEFVNLISTFLSESFGTVCIQGEVSGYREPRGQSVFFTLKDDKSQVNCFALIYNLNVPLKDGLELKIYGVPKLFQKSGQFYLFVQEVELIGEGALQKAYLELKKKLAAEGLFLEQHKKNLPAFPRSIGIITAKDGAAYKDIIKRLNERWGGLDIFFYPIKVQGVGAAKQIIEALRYFNEERPCDVLILTRGGGSLEDYQPFNEERVVRAVFASKTPIICGIGHERDVCLAELAADVRASTPTNAAEIVVPHKRELKFKIEQLILMAERTLTGAINDYKQLIKNLLKSLDESLAGSLFEVNQLLLNFEHATNFLNQRVIFYKQKLTNCHNNMVTILANRVENISIKIQHSIELLKRLSPQATLKRGFTLTSKNGKIVKSSRELSDNEKIKTQFQDGTVISQIIKNN